MLLGNRCWWQPPRHCVETTRLRVVGVRVWEGRSAFWVPQSCGDLFPRCLTFPVAGAAPSTLACSSLCGCDQYHVSTGFQADQCFLRRFLRLPSTVCIGTNHSNGSFLRLYGSPGRDGRRDSKQRFTPDLVHNPSKQENDEIQKRLSTQN